MKKIKLTIALSILGIGGAIAQEASENIFNDDCWTQLKKTSHYSVDNNKGELRYMEHHYEQNIETHPYPEDLEYSEIVNENLISRITYVGDGFYIYILEDSNGKTLSKGALLTTDKRGKTINDNFEIIPYYDDLEYIEIINEKTCFQVIKKGFWIDYNWKTKERTSVEYK